MPVPWEVRCLHHVLSNGQADMLVDRNRLSYPSVRRGNTAHKAQRAVLEDLEPRLMTFLVSLQAC